MSTLSRILSSSALALGAGVLSAAPAFAFTDFALDELRLEYSHADQLHATYVDTFDDANPLTGPTLIVNGTQSPISGNAYSTSTRSGAAPAPGSESGGKLRFAWDDMIDANPGGIPPGRVLNYTLNTATQFTADNGNPLVYRGLFKANDFRYTTIWDFQLGTETDSFRARLTDSAPSYDYAGDDLLDLGVVTTGDGQGFQVRQRRVFRAAGTSEQVILSGDLRSWLGQFDQIGLSFGHAAGDSFVTTHFALMHAGTIVHQADLGTLTLFSGEDWTRASFSSYALSAPVSEPQIGLMLLAGLGAMGFSARRRRIALDALR